MRGLPDGSQMGELEYTMRIGLTAYPRTLRVGKISIGLFGLDIALNRVAGDASLNNKVAARQVFEEISRQNYVPSGATES